MYKIQNIKSKDDIVKAHQIITTAFSTVAKEFSYTKESVPTFPAFIDVNVVITQIENGLLLFAYVDKDQMLGTIGIKHIESSLYKIERLAVLPDQRHKKIGYVLMEHAIKCITEKDGKTAKVEIVYENLLLKKWYENLGFKLVDIEKYEHLPFQVGVLIKELC